MFVSPPFITVVYTEFSATGGIGVMDVDGGARQLITCELCDLEQLLNLSMSQFLHL